MRYLLAFFFIFYSASAICQPKGRLETPKNGTAISGKYMFSGWVCEAELVEVVIDGGSGLKAAYGTARGDTESTCGDSDNGFGLLVNMANLGAGEHQAVVFADGQEVGRSTFTVTELSTGKFSRDLEALALESNFPSFGREVWLNWVESTQNFMITREQNTPDPYDISGGWYSDTYDAGALITTARFYADREEVWVMLAYSGGWELYSGYVNGTRAEVQTISPFGPNVSATIDFSDFTTGVITVNSCFSANGYICALNAGTRVSIRKIVGNDSGANIPQDGIFSVAEEGE